MATPASIKKHPIHTILVPIPIGLWLFALVADILAGSSNDPAWRTVAFYCLGGGVVGALLAAVPGLIDLLSLRDPAARRIGFLHMGLNLAAVALFGVNFFLRRGAVDHAGPLWLTILGVAAIGVSGWLGGELVYRHGVGVDLLPGSRPAPGSNR